MILMEHGGVGMAFGRAGLRYGIRLACRSLDRADNDFVGRAPRAQLHPLSIIVQRMRKSPQTSLHLERLGPFFVGKVAWQSGVTASAGAVTEASRPRPSSVRAAVSRRRTPVWLLRRAGRTCPSTGRSASGSMLEARTGARRR